MSKISDKIAELKNLYVSSKFPGNNWPLKGGLTQRDNKLFPSGSCNVTAAANCLDYLDIEISQKIRNKYHYVQTEDILSAILETPESYREFKNYYKDFDYKKSEVRPRHFSQMIAWAVNLAVGFRVANWCEIEFDSFVNHVERSKPVVVGGKFTASGHFIAIKGVSFDRTFFWVDDSWGDFYSGYRRRYGHNLRYFYDDIRRLCWSGLRKHRCIVFERGS